MTNRLPDIYTFTAVEGLLLQGATDAAIGFLASLGELANGTTALVPLEIADQTLSEIDEMGLLTLTMG